MNKEFEDQYKSPLWQKKRLEILQRDEYTCQWCGDTKKQLHVHHRSYLKDKKIWEYEDGFYVTFCNDCHERAHDKKKEFNELTSHIKEEFLEDYMQLLISVSELNPCQLDCISALINSFKRTGPF